MVQLADELVASLDATARRRGISRSAPVGQAIEAFLAEEGEAARPAGPGCDVGSVEQGAS